MKVPVTCKHCLVATWIGIALAMCIGAWLYIASGRVIASTPISMGVYGSGELRILMVPLSRNPLAMMFGDSVFICEIRGRGTNIAACRFNWGSERIEVASARMATPEESHKFGDDCIDLAVFQMDKHTATCCFAAFGPVTWKLEKFP